MSVPAIIVLALALVFIIGGPIFGSYANKAHQNENKTTDTKKSDK